MKKMKRSNNKRYFNAGFSTPLQAGAMLPLILIGVIAFTGATNLFGLNGSAYAEYTISMTSSGAQSIDILPDASNVNTSISVDAVTVTTTCPAGYNLTTTTSVNDNKLYLNGSSSNNATDTYFNPSDGTTALSNAPNTWGFYQDGSTVPTASSVFKPVPTSTSTPATIRTSSSTSDSFNIYYGVAAGSGLAPGTYKMIPEQNTNENGTIVYYLTMAEECMTPKQYMQDMTEADLAELMPNDGDSATLYDKRDESDYQITRIAGRYWMTQNLRITHTEGQPVGTILAENSNFNNDITFDGDLTSGNSYVAKRYHTPTETDLSTLGLTADQVGVWYNYCAVSAGTVCNSTDTVDATEDICPAGWGLPSLEQIKTILPYKTSLPLYFTGYYSAGSLTSANQRGYWWSSSANNATTQYSLRYLTNGSSTTFVSTTSNKRYGFSTRCVKKSDSPSESPLYDLVAAQSKGAQTLAELRAEITTSNSGVYEYNSSVFGAASDAANTSKIYYYRGILDNTTGSYGSDGDNAAWPNTVVLSSASSKSGLTTNDTCWRIVRTTGSGGVKMIYQGKWTGSTCANKQAAAQLTYQAFGLQGNSQSTDWYFNINRVGYTFNNTASIQDITTATSVDTVFGSNSSPSTNNERSNIKTYIEDTWYPGSIGASSGHNFTSKLEASAGYCNDRTAFTDESGTSSMSTIPPYATSGATMYFGPYTRVVNATSASTNRPSLNCQRSTVDLYRYVAGSTGVSNRLKYPVALITADEAAFAGSGYSSSTTPYHAKSYLRSGSAFWLLSPSYRRPNGYASGFNLHPDGHLACPYVSSTDGVRPAISLKPGSMAVSGSGTAADPWIVNLPNPYCTDASTCMQNTTNPPACGTTMTDGRDGATYTTATIAGTCWMTQNLRFTGAELKVGESDVTSDITMNYGSLTSGNSYTEPRIATGSTTDYGTYYNYCAASAGEVCNDTTQQDATRSVCPAGWKLPTQAQLNALPSKDSHFTASSGLAGYYVGGSLSSAGTYGDWWASTADSATNQYRLLYTSGNDYWGVSGSSKYRGYSVRCVRAS
ncbi:hypothetical protein IKD67_01520 [Candidatus Saccharibacteria bacterium]|nr:hypothetical protein [Candidatus Saccharibacteria bacterium]